MTPDTPQPQTPAPNDKDHHAVRQMRKRRRRKAGFWSLLSMTVLAGVPALWILSYLGTPIVVPDWLRGQITQRINAQTGPVQVELGRMVVIIEKGWKPRLALRNVVLRGADGVPLARLSELGGTMALRPLLRGEVQPGTIRLSGLQLNLRRERAGGMGVLMRDTAPAKPFATEGAGQNAALGIHTLIAQIDDALQRPALSALTSITADNLTLRYEDARAGRAWNVDGGQATLTRAGDDLRMRGDFFLLGDRSYATSLELSYASQIGLASAEIGVNFEDAPADELALQSPALAWLGALDAPISGALRVGVDNAGALGPLNATLHIGKGVLQPNDATKPIAFDSARSYFTYDPKAQTLHFESLSVDSKWVTASAEGTAFLVGLEDGWPRELQAQMRIRDIIADPADLYPEPIQIDAAMMDLRLELDPFRLSIGQFSLSDQGRNLVFNGELRGKDTGWDLALDGRMDGISRDRLMQLWPELAIPKTRKWVAENVQAGELSNVQLAVRSHPKHRADLFLGFDFDQMTTKFMRQMPLITGASGHASLFDNRFVIRAETGQITPPEGGVIEVGGTSFVVPDVTVHNAPAQAFVNIASNITATLSLLDEKPFEFLKKQGRPVTLAEGRTVLEGVLDFPLKKNLKTKDVRFAFTGALNDVRSTVLVPGRVLSSQALRLNVDNDTLSVGGDGHLGDVPFTGSWRAPLGVGAGPSQVNGTVALGQGFVDEFGIGLPEGSLSGTAKGEIDITLPKGGTGDFTLTSDLAGLGMALPQLDWRLAQGTRGKLEVRGQLGTPPQITRLALDAPGLTASGAVSLRTGGQLDRATFGRVQVGGWLDAPVTLIGRGAGQTPAVEVRGGTVDMRQTTLSGGRQTGQGAGRKQGGPIDLALNQLTISDGLALTDFRAQLDTSRGTDGNFSGRVNGGAPVTGRIVPQNGRSAFRIQSKAAGQVLGSAGLLKGARGGQMDLILTPSAAAGTYEGQLEASDVWLTDAPALAALLSSLSVVGLLEQMSGKGILFNQIDARFRLGPDRATLYSGSAVGASMGITMDGYYFLKEGRMDMQGVVSPIYMLNQVGGILTRQGEGLLGFNYTLKGSASKPKVSVNPLSLLTPGMFREIFRRPPPGQVSRNGGTVDTQSQPSTNTNTRSREFDNGR
ncbi:DUF3971 domain-containing protein [Rhodobacteraceae bacterium KMM 6894]|nr:DUF3971 domain-containing protein [Rhodobacteraceae bacterium KMM 6894]